MEGPQTRAITKDLVNPIPIDTILKSIQYIILTDHDKVYNGTYSLVKTKKNYTKK